MFRAAKIHLVFGIVIVSFVSFIAIEVSSQTKSENRAEAEILNRRAIRLIHEKKFEAAIQLLSKAIELEPKYADAHVNLGSAYLLSDRPQIAVGHIKKSLELDPTSHIGYNQLAVTYDNLGQTNLAIQALEKSVEVKPDYALGFLNLGKLYLEDNRLKKAEASLEKGLKLDPSREGEKLYLAAAYARQARFNDAIAVAKHVTEHQPANDSAKLMLCRIYLMANDRESALQMYQSYKATNVSLADEMFRSIFGGQILDASKQARP